MPLRSSIVFCALVSIFAAAASAQTATERAEKFGGAGNSPLEGTLLLPAGADGRKVPAVLLIAGSGPIDRDGNVVGIEQKGDMLKQFAERLAANGVASFRYDKRGLRNTPDVPAKDEDLPAYLSWENFQADALAAFRHLAALPDIDGARVAVLGHSEGGFFALLIARDAGERGPAALILAASTARSYDKLAYWQLDQGMIRAGLSAEDREAANKEHVRIIEHIRNTGKAPPDVHPSFAPIYAPTRTLFLQSAYRIDPIRLAKGYKGPVLILHGEMDVIASAELDAKALAGALAERPAGEHKLAILAKTNHHFRSVEAPTDMRMSGPLPDAVAGALTEWLAARLGARR
jgi:hypothetical protein